MIGIPPSLKELIQNLSLLPGIGPKSARRIAFFLLEKPQSTAERLADSIGNLKAGVSFCQICGALTEQDTCMICGDISRDISKICIVETFIDQIILENLNYYHGLYHILGGTLSPLDGRGPKQLRIDSLLTRIRQPKVEEVIIATNPTPEGNATALFIVDLLKNYSVNLTRIGLGIPVGGDIDLLDSETLKLALEGRMKIEKHVDG